MPTRTDSLPRPARRLLPALAAVLSLAFASAAPAGESASAGAVSWMTADAAAKTVVLDIVSGWNGNNSALNYNGYHDGDATVTVPAGWTVEIKFTNNDSNLPHSIVLTKTYTKEEMPETAGRAEVAIPRAYSRDPEAGIAGGEKDDFRFKAATAGKYLMICGAPGHARSGMWIHFEVSGGKEPAFAAAKDVGGRP
ncbi:MAG: sulfocyanin-like copper-binding protein [Alphaproteobacteria bacterium]